ncbi:hypothetical protein, partial [Gluconobacter oxydans]|uniref:hypothetical protein n=1 Tax=Gluconobacter oxydans TaxID=442 RepID=UPI0039EC25D7
KTKKAPKRRFFLTETGFGVHSSSVGQPEADVMAPITSHSVLGESPLLLRDRHSSEAMRLLNMRQHAPSPHQSFWTPPDNTLDGGRRRHFRQLRMPADEGFWKNGTEKPASPCDEAGFLNVV